MRIAINANISVEMKIYYMKNAVLNDIIDDKINLEDGVNQLLREIMIMLYSNEGTKSM